MLVTHTELIDLLRKLFEGLGYGLGEDDDCAKAVAWLAMRDRPILQQLANNPAAYTPAACVSVLAEDVAQVTIDGSAGNVMGIAADFVRYKRLSADSITMVIKDSPLPMLIVPYLARMGGTATWADNGVQHLVSASGWELRSAESIQPLIVTSNQTTQPFDLFTDRYHAHLENGLPVSDEVWQALQTLARAILVPESDYSRQYGAG